MDNVTKQLVQQLKQEFPEVSVYSENMEPAPEPPYFMVQPLSVVQQRETSRQYTRQYVYDILYFPALAEKNAECMEKGAQLAEKVEYLQALIARGNSISWKITEGVLHFLVTYVFHFEVEQVQKPQMKRLQQEGNMHL